MDFYAINKGGFRSPSVPREAVSCVLVPAGTKIRCETHGPRPYWTYPDAVYIVGDYLREEGDILVAKKIRQIVDAAGWGVHTTKWGFHQCWISPSPVARAFCEKHNVEWVHVTGGLYPIVDIDHVAVPDFKTSGARWYIMPLVDLTKEMLDACADSPVLERGFHKFTPYKIAKEHISV